MKETMKKLSIILLALMLAVLTGCGSTANEDQAVDQSVETVEGVFEYQYLTAEETADTLKNLDGYYDDINKKTLQYFMQKKDVSVDEFVDYSQEQALDFTDEEKTLLDKNYNELKKKVNDAGMTMPEKADFAVAKTTMDEASQASAYTHGTTVFLGQNLLNKFMGKGEDQDYFQMILAHELFHCLTRNNPDFRADMYKLINFTITGENFDIPKKVKEQIIANPDVEHHDSYATFTINGEKKDCYLVFLTKDNFQKPGDSFFNNMYTGLVDIKDGSLYSYEDASDFYDVLGHNTDYCEDPEECMAMNFGFALSYGMDGVNGDGYNSPEIIENIIKYMQNLE